VRSIRGGVIAVLLSVFCAACSGPSAEPPHGPDPLPPPADSSFRHEAAGIEFDVPGGWRSKTSTDRMTFAAPDGLLTVVLFTAPDEQMGVLADEVNRQIGKIVANPVVEGDLVTTEMNGIPVLVQHGTGTVDGKSIEWRVRLVEAQQHVLVLAFGVPGSFDRHFAELDRFERSIRRDSQ